MALWVTAITVVSGATSCANGVPPDAKTVSAQGLHSYYQDEYIFGADQQLDNNWVVGAKAMYRRLRSLIDDSCDSAPLQTWGDENGLSDEVKAGIGRSTGCCRPR